MQVHGFTSHKNNAVFVLDMRKKGTFIVIYKRIIETAGCNYAILLQ